MGFDGVLMYYIISVESESEYNLLGHINF